jgi:Ran GTPase-activating protein (RanGAP) involved in mRNA processing and transport
MVKEMESIPETLLHSYRENVQQRLVLADWLEERGHVQGKLLALAHLQTQLRSRDPAWLVTKKEQQGILNPLAEHLARRWGVYLTEQEHGALLGVTVAVDSALWFHPDPEELFNELPLLCTWTLVVNRDSVADWGQMVRSPVFAKMVRLRICGGRPDESQWQCFWEHATLHQLQELQLAWLPLEHKALKAWVQCPHLNKLRSLTMRNAAIGAYELKSLSNSPWIGQLTHLDVSHNQLAEAGAKAIFTLPIKQLRHLALQYTQLRDKPLQLLENSGWLSSLQSLDVEQNFLTSGSLEALGSWDLPHLCSLQIGSNEIAFEQAPPFFQASWLPQLETLSLGWLNWRENSSDLLSQALFDKPPRLKSLNLERTKISPQAFRLLAECPGLAKLERLCLTHNAIGEEFLKAMAKPDCWRHLQQLSLADNVLTAKAVSHFQHATDWEQLTCLDLARNRLDDNAAEPLRDAPWFSNLKEFSLSGNRMTTQGVQKIFERGNQVALQTINVAYNRLKGDNVDWLQTLEQFADLRQLDVGNNPLSSGQLRYLLSSSVLDGIEQLGLARMVVNASFLKILADHPSICGLHVLDITGHKAANLGIALLAEAPSLKNLRRLILIEGNQGYQETIVRGQQSSWYQMTALVMAQSYLGLELVFAIKHSSPLVGYTEINHDSSFSRN